MDTTNRLYLGKYEVKELLGEGGMGRVYLAFQHDLKRKVVVKVMHEQLAQDPKFRQQFEHEMQAQANFQHPYAVSIYQGSLDDPHGPCIVMEYIHGITLEKLLEQNKGRLSAPRISRLLSQLCDVLQAAHDKGIVHRDLKPANVMILDPETPFEKIKVMDFGLAMMQRNPLKKVDDGGDAVAVGTPAYMCPEQVRGDEMDHRGDLYSVGVILFELLTGRLPFMARDPMDVMLAHATEPPPSFADVDAAQCASPAVEELVHRLLSKEPADRPASARELAQLYLRALEHVEDAPAGATSAEPAEPKAFEVPEDQDPTVLVYRFEAWMPETIAIYKLSGFVQDVGADVLHNEPGKVRFRLGKPGTVYAGQGGTFAWLGFGRASLIDLEIRMHPAGEERKGHLHLAILMRSPAGELPSNPAWKSRCDRIYTDLRAYLMGK